MEHKKIGAGVILIDKQSGDILLGRRSFESPSPNSYSIFGGTFELIKDSSPEQTAKREVEEESGINSEEYQMSSDPFFVQNTPKLKFYNYIGVSDGKFPVTIDKEHLSYGWYPLTHLPSNLHPGFQELINKKGGILKKIIEKLKNKPDDEKPN
jgi:ADP-ribose pyrophosphatase YjhB (NUDIX family)